MRHGLLAPVALSILVLTGCARLEAEAPAKTPPAKPAPAAAAATPAAPVATAAAQPAGPSEVVLKSGERIACVEPPAIAFGRIVYKTADGARHSLPEALVDIEATRPQKAKTPPVIPQDRSAAGAEGRRPAPDFTATRADGSAVKLSELKGKVVLVDFWATWCRPCVMEMPNVKAAYDNLKAEPFEIVGVSLDHDQASLMAFTSSQGMAWPQYFDGQGWGNAVARSYGVSSIPTTVLLDRRGLVARRGLRGPMLEQAIRDLLAEPAATATEGT